MGPVGPIHLLGPVGAIHLLGPVGAIHLAPLLFRQFLEQVVILVIFHQKLTFGGICVFKGRFFPQEFSPKARTPVV